MMAMTNNDDPKDWADTDLWQGIKDAKNDRFARPDDGFEF